MNQLSQLDRIHFSVGWTLRIITEIVHQLNDSTDERFNDYASVHQRKQKKKASFTPANTPVVVT